MCGEWLVAVVVLRANHGWYSLRSTQTKLHFELAVGVVVVAVVGVAHLVIHMLKNQNEAGFIDTFGF